MGSADSTRILESRRAFGPMIHTINVLTINEPLDFLCLFFFFLLLLFVRGAAGPAFGEFSNRDRPIGSN